MDPILPPGVGVEVKHDRYVLGMRSTHCVWHKRVRYSYHRYRRGPTGCWCIYWVRQTWNWIWLKMMCVYIQSQYCILWLCCGTMRQIMWLLQCMGINDKSTQCFLMNVWLISTHKPTFGCFHWINLWGSPAVEIETSENLTFCTQVKIMWHRTLPVFAVTGRVGWLRPPLFSAMMLSEYSVYGVRDLTSAGEEYTVSSLKKPLAFWIRMM